MSRSPEREPAADLARRIVDAGQALPRQPGARLARELGWALKDLCYASWSSDPARAVSAAKTLQALHMAADGAAGEVAALADWTAGIAHITQGGMTEAIACFDRAAAAFDSLGLANPAAQTQVPKIVALSMQGQHELAAQCAERAQQAFTLLGDRRAAGRVSLNLGTLHWRRGDYALAARHSREAVLLFARVGDTEHSVMADIGLADALTALGDMDEALRIYARARMRAGTHGLPVLEAIVDESVALLELSRGRFREALAGLELSRRHYDELAMPQQLAVAEKQLADAYLELRLLPEALALFDQSLARFAALELADEEAWTLAQRGRALALLHRGDQAGASLLRAAALFSAQGNGVGEAAVSLVRAELALNAGHAAPALVLARQAAAGFAASGQAERSTRADAWCARALLRMGNVAEARAGFDATLARARALRVVPVQLKCLTGLGLCARAEGRDEAAREAFDAAIELFEVQRNALPGDEFRSAFLSEHLLPYQELLRMALDAHARSPDTAPAADAWRQLERFRARALGDRLAQGPRDDEQSSNGAQRSHVNWLHRRIQRLQDEGESASALVDALHVAERELLEQSRRERLASPLTASVVDPDAALDPTQALGEHDALVEYGVLDDELFACIVTRSGVQLRRGLARWGEVLEAAESARFQIETLRHGAAPLQAHLARLDERTRVRLARLHALLWAPLDSALGDVRRVLIVPHGALGSVPFAALHDGAAYLGERYALALAPSARVAWRTLPARPMAATRALVLGETRGLPHAAQEARFVAGLFPEGAAHVDEQATLALVRSEARDADVIHFACHAQFRGDNPMFSALHLHDGALTVEATETLELSAGLVVLSACETGLSAQSSGDEMFGLVRAFLVAGASRVVASLWPVDDEATAAFMGHFYRALCAGAGPSLALQQAQNQVRARHSNPFYWAAFTLYGCW